MGESGSAPYLLYARLIGVMAQRLVRVWKEETKIPYTENQHECEVLGVDAASPPTLYRPGSGGNRGFAGRTGIYELITVDDRMREMIHDNVSEQKLERHARTSSLSIRADGRRQVQLGRTTREEVMRVTHED